MRTYIRFCLQLVLVLFGSAHLYGGLEQYFKKAEGKSGQHGMRNIDFIYCINLDRRPEKFATCTQQLHPLGIYPYRFSAVNGWELTLEDINNLGVPFTPGMDAGTWGTYYVQKEDGTLDAQHEVVGRPGQTYFCHCMSRGAIGIVLSHLSILQDAYDSGYETIWVMEDDIQLIRDPHLISDLIANLDSTVGKNKWDLLFTDRDTKNNNGEYVPCTGHAWRPNYKPSQTVKFAIHRNVSLDFMRIGARYGAYSMIVRRSGMKKILDFVKKYKIFLPYDMDFYLPPNIVLYAVRDDVVSTQINALSDNGGANYLQKE